MLVSSVKARLVLNFWLVLVLGVLDVTSTYVHMYVCTSVDRMFTVLDSFWFPD